MTNSKAYLVFFLSFLFAVCCSDAPEEKVSHLDLVSKNQNEPIKGSIDLDFKRLEFLNFRDSFYTEKDVDGVCFVEYGGNHLSDPITIMDNLGEVICKIDMSNHEKPLLYKGQFFGGSDNFDFDPFSLSLNEDYFSLVFV